MFLKTVDRYRSWLMPHGLIYAVLSIILVVLLVLTIVFGIRSTNNSVNTSYYSSIPENRIIGYPIQLPPGDRSVQWTFLHFNDIYELLPLDRGRKGGLARVAYIKELLKKENPHTYTILAGDLLSPSALGLSRVNGTMLNGRQMVLTMNELGLDFMIFGNHEFDISESELLRRMNESNFTWISTNIFKKNTREQFGSSIPHKIITIDSVRILFLGLTLDGYGPYVTIINQSVLVDYVQEYLRSLPSNSYDVLVAITHLDMSVDIALITRIPQIDLIVGGHEHENYYYLRGTKYKPIYKADANAFTVYIHRCVFNLDKKRLDIHSTLARVTSDLREENKTAAVANYWFNLGMEAFRADGYEPDEVISCLPDGVELDGRSEAVRSMMTLLTASICESLLYATQYNGTVIGLINGGTVRIDDVLRETITQYDVLRTLPFTNDIVALSVPGSILARVLVNGASLKGNGMFLVATNVTTSDGGKTWFYNGVDIATSGLEYRVATTDYIRDNTGLNNQDVTTLHQSNITQTKGLMNYLRIKYPPC